MSPGWGAIINDLSSENPYNNALSSPGGFRHTEIYYIYRLPVVANTIEVNSAGDIFEEYNFDPWGRRCNPPDWSYNNVPTAQITDSGFTGHEHLDEFGLINMNGRMYDQVLGRFLGVDPVVADITSSQAFNGYSYCVNNPLKYSDTSGYSYLQSMKDAYNGIGRFYYRGGVYQIGEDGGWDFYSGGFSGGYTCRADLSYAARHSDPYHIDSQGNLRDKNGYIVVYSYQREDDEYGHWESEVVDYSGAGTHPVFKNGKLQWVDIDCVGVIQKWVWDTPQNGTIISVANGAAAIGPIGIMADIGGVFDSEGNSSMYLTIGWVTGLGATAGLGYSRTSKNFSLDNFAGYSEGVLLQIPYVKVIGIEGFADYSNGCESEYRGQNYIGGGLNVGVGATYGVYHSYTFIFPAPPPGFWCQPSKHF